MPSRGVEVEIIYKNNLEVTIQSINLPCLSDLIF